jgi:hypothetical protein
MVSYKNTAEAILRLTRWWSMNDVWDCGMAYTIGPTFEEAYEIRAAIISDRVLHLGQVKQVAHSFCDRALSTQGIAEENMYYMGYAANRDANGVPACSCVADACSSAAAILDTVKAYPDSPRSSDYIASVQRFADYVLGKYADENGVMGVGILGHSINPWKQYWCACSLLVQVLIDLYELTEEAKYLDAVIPQLEYLSVYDYRNTPCNNWGLAATEVVMYAGEGIVNGLNSKSVCRILDSRPAPSISAVTNDKTEEVIAALNRVKADEVGDTLGGGAITALDALKLRWAEFSDWLYRNQELCGIWQDSKDYRCYQLGLSWLLAESAKSTGLTPEVEIMIDRQMACMVGVEGITYHGLFCRPFATALAHFSAARIAELRANEDLVGFHAALAEARDRLPVMSW